MSRTCFPDGICTRAHSIFVTSICTMYQRLYQKVSGLALAFEPPRGRTNNVVSVQVHHKPACTSTEKS